MQTEAVGYLRYLIHKPMNAPHTNGFTLIELIVVFSVMAIIATISLASFDSYTNSQKLRTSVLDIKTLLQQARSESINQLKPASCTGTLQGYEVRICAGNTCNNSANDYELDALCSVVPNGILISGSTFPSGVTLDANGTTQKSFRFIPITGGIVQGGTIMLDGANSAKQSIVLTTSGVIQ